MNERTQEELRELANKYNGAVNEIKDLTDKIKARTISVFIQDVEIKSPHFMMPLLSPPPFFLSFSWLKASKRSSRKKARTKRRSCSCESRRWKRKSKHFKLGSRHYRQTTTSPMRGSQLFKV